MRRGLRETIRRKPDYERDPDWDLSEVLEGKNKNSKHQKSSQKNRGTEILDDEFLSLDEDLLSKEEQ